MSAVIVQGSFLVDPDDRDQFLDASLRGIAASRSEPGCQEYILAADPADPSRVVVSERWESRKHLQQHIQAASTRRAEDDAQGQRRPEVLERLVNVYEVVDVT